MNLEKYIRTMKEAYHKAYSTYEGVRMHFDAALENFANEAVEKNMSPERAAVQREDIENKFSADVEQIKGDVQAVVDEQSAEFNREVSAFYAPDGSRIDLNEMNLIKSELLLSMDNIWDKIVKYSDNVTMLRIFQKYVSENKIQLEGDTGKAIAAVFHRISENGDNERCALKLFISLAGAGVNSIGAEGSYDPINKKTTFSDAYYCVMNKLDEYELQAQIRILEASPVIDEAVQKEIDSRDVEITQLQEARGMKKNPRLNWRQLL